jgi:NADH:ubiquinone oxidoreductase subunit 5 (subunit L)/multisubunit Na+/H+ antiporter MnhA subunit
MALTLTLETEALLTVLVPLVLAPIALVAGYASKKKIVDYTASIIAFITLSLVSLVLFKYMLGGHVAIDFSLSMLSVFSFRADALSLLFASVIAAMGFFTIFYSIKYLEGDSGRGRYYFWMLVFVGSMISLVTSANLLMLYISWELVGLASYFLIGHWYTEKKRTEDAKKVFFMTHLPGEALLLAVLASLALTNTYSITDLLTKTNPTWAMELIKIFLFIAMISKSVQYPFYTWLPSAMSGPTPVSALLHSATMVQAGVYLAARFLPLYLGGDLSWQIIFMLFGGTTLLIASINALRAVDLKHILAYSTISSIGYMFLAFGFGIFGLIAGLLHFLTHAFFKCCLFLGAGAVDHEAHTVDINRLGGLYKKMPITATCFTISALALAGVPPLSGFASKWLMFGAGIAATGTAPGFGVFIIVLMLGSVLSAGYALRAVHSVFFGHLPENLKDAKEVSPIMWVPQLLLTVGTVVLGVLVQIPVMKLIAYVPGVGGVSKSAVLGIGVPGPAGMSATYSAVLATALLLIAVVIGIALARPQRKPNVSDERAELFGCGEPLPQDVQVSGHHVLYQVMKPFGGVDRIDPDRFWYKLGPAVAFVSGSLRSPHNGNLNRYTLWILVFSAFAMIVLLGGW